MESLGKALMLGGLVLVAVGALLFWGGPRWGWLGRLPGDIRTENFSFPVVTSLLVSLVLTVVLNLLLRWFGR